MSIPDQRDEKIELQAATIRQLTDRLQKAEGSNARLATQVVALVEERQALKDELDDARHAERIAAAEVAAPALPPIAIQALVLSAEETRHFDLALHGKVSAVSRALAQVIHRARLEAGLV
jgi:hypothetical protein